MRMEHDMRAQDLQANPFHLRMRNGAGGLFWFGLALLLVGCAAILFPMVSSIAATVLVGWIFLIAGGLVLGGAFSIHGTGPFFSALLFSLLSLGAGCFLLFNPAAGAAALTLLLGITFLLQGATEMVFAVEMRPLRGWAGMLLSGIASILVALVILAGWPGISLIALGILLGVNFITTGLGSIAASRAFRR